MLQTLIVALINDSTFLSFNGLLIDDIRFDARFFIQLCYSHVKKEGNKVACKKAYLSRKFKRKLRGKKGLRLERI